MAVYGNGKSQGFQSILNASLGEYQSKGFRLTESADHFLNLFHQDGLVCSFSQSGATIPSIHEACRNFLESISAS